MTVMHLGNIRRYLALLAKTGNVDRAAAAVGISLSTLYKHKRENPAFREAWADAQKRGVALPAEVDEDPLTEEAFRRVFEGTKRPVYHRGERIGTVRDYHDPLLVQLLRIQERRRERQEKLDAAQASPARNELRELLESIDGTTRSIHAE